MHSEFEVERKWLVNGKPNLPILEEHVVHQAYLYADDNIEVRLVIRFDADTYNTMQPHINRRKLTIKMGNGLVRREAEIVLTEEQCADLVRHVQGKFITKLFTIYDLGGGHTWEQSSVDPNEECGFMYAEKEFGSKEEADAYVVPTECREIICCEVTGEETYQMKNYWRRTRMGQNV